MGLFSKTRYFTVEYFDKQSIKLGDFYPNYRGEYLTSLILNDSPNLIQRFLEYPKLDDSAKKIKNYIDQANSLEACSNTLGRDKNYLRCKPSLYLNNLSNLFFSTTKFEEYLQSKDDLASKPEIKVKNIEVEPISLTKDANVEDYLTQLLDPNNPNIGVQKPKYEGDEYLIQFIRQQLGIAENDDLPSLTSSNGVQVVDTTDIRTHYNYISYHFPLRRSLNDADYLDLYNSLPALNASGLPRISHDGAIPSDHFECWVGLIEYNYNLINFSYLDHSKTFYTKDPIKSDVDGFTAAKRPFNPVEPIPDEYVSIRDKIDFKAQLQTYSDVESGDVIVNQPTDVPLKEATLNFTNGSVNLGLVGFNTFKLTGLGNIAYHKVPGSDYTPNTDILDSPLNSNRIIKLTYTIGDSTEEKVFYYPANSFSISYTQGNSRTVKYLEGSQEDRVDIDFDLVQTEFGRSTGRYDIVPSTPIRHNYLDLVQNYDTIQNRLFGVNPTDVLNQIKATIVPQNGINYNNLVHTVDLHFRASLGSLNPNTIKYILSVYNSTNKDDPTEDFFLQNPDKLGNTPGIKDFADEAYEDVIRAEFLVDDSVTLTNYAFNEVLILNYSNPIGEVDTLIDSRTQGYWNSSIRVGEDLRFTAPFFNYLNGFYLEVVEVYKSLKDSSGLHSGFSFPNEDEMYALDMTKDRLQEYIDQLEGDTPKKYFKISSDFKINTRDSKKRYEFKTWGIYTYDIDSSKYRIEHPNNMKGYGIVVYFDIQGTDDTKNKIYIVNYPTTTDYIREGTVYEKSKQFNGHNASLPLFTSLINRGGINKNELYYDSLSVEVFLYIYQRRSYKEPTFFALALGAVFRFIGILTLLQGALSLLAGESFKVAFLKLAEDIVIRELIFAIIDEIFEDPYIRAILKIYVVYKLSDSKEFGFEEILGAADRILNAYVTVEVKELQTEEESLSTEIEEYNKKSEREFEDLAELNDVLFKNSKGEEYNPLNEGYEVQFAFTNIKPYTYVKLASQPYLALKPDVSKNLPYLRDDIISI